MGSVRFVVLACATMLLLAGCSGGPAPSTGPNGPTDVPATTAEARSGLEGLDTPPWLTVDGVNASRLLDAHAASLEDTSYRVDARLNASGLYALDQTTTARVGPDDRRVYVVRTRTDRTNATTRAFANDTWVVLERTNATATVYSDYRVDGSRTRFDVTPAVREYVRLGDYALNRTYTVDGGVRIEYVAASAADVSGAGGVESYRGRLVVSPDGRVRDLRVDVTESSVYGDVNTTFSFSLRGVGGVDASDPSWVSTAREAATTIDVTYTYDDGVVELEHRGGDVVPAGTQVSVTAVDGRGQFTAVLPREFGPGDTLAVAPADDGALAVAFGSAPTTDAGFDGRVRVQLTGADDEVVVRTTLEPGENATATTRGIRRATASIPRADRWKQN